MLWDAQEHNDVQPNILHRAVRWGTFNAVANRAYTWKSELGKVVESNWKIGQDFNFVHEYEPYFKGLYPSNFNIRDTLSDLAATPR